MLLTALSLTALALVGGSALTGSQFALPDAPLPNFTNIWVIFMENRDYSQIIHNAAAPYLNLLASSYGLATKYYAIEHGSQPNYIAFFSGDDYGVTGGSTPNLDGPNLADQLETAHHTWKEFAQNYPGHCFNGTTASGGADGPGTYVRRHAPAIAFRNIRKSPGRCANVLDFSHFDPSVADFELIIPNLTDDMHDGTTRDGDQFLRRFVPRIIDSTAWKNGGALFIVFDEGRETGSNRVALLVVSPLVRPGFRSDVLHDHYSLLRTIEDAWHLGCLGNACTANTLGEFFTRSAH